MIYLYAHAQATSFGSAFMHPFWHASKQQSCESPIGCESGQFKHPDWCLLELLGVNLGWGVDSITHLS